MKIEKRLSNLELVPESAEDRDLSAQILYRFGCLNAMRVVIRDGGFTLEGSQECSQGSIDSAH